MLDLTDHFDLVRVINLRRFPERRQAFEIRAKHAGITGFEIQEAIEGDLAPPPVWWGNGRKGAYGAWGCLMSHLRAAQDALMGGAGSLLIFEDDCVFTRDFAERLPRIMAEAGGDWDMLYLGGEHLDHGKPWREDGKQELLHGYNVNRTHAYAIHGRFLVKFAQHILHAPDYIARNTWHFDHQLGALHQRGKHRILAAHPWVCGQAAGKSWTTGRETIEHWWGIGEEGIR